MAQLGVVWRNSNLMRQVRPRRLQRYDFGSIAYSVQELVSPGQPEIWIAISTFELLLRQADTRVADRNVIKPLSRMHHDPALGHVACASDSAPVHNH